MFAFFSSLSLKFVVFWVDYVSREASTGLTSKNVRNHGLQEGRFGIHLTVCALAAWFLVEASGSEACSEGLPVMLFMVPVGQQLWYWAIVCPISLCRCVPWHEPGRSVTVPH